MCKVNSKLNSPNKVEVESSEFDSQQLMTHTAHFDCDNMTCKLLKNQSRT